MKKWCQKRGKYVYLEHISGSDPIWGAMDALLEEMTHNLGQKDEKELSRSEEAMIPTEKNSTKCKGLKVQMSMANWQNKESPTSMKEKKEMTWINLERI